jgi:hypothetical protein
MSLLNVVIGLLVLAAIVVAGLLAAGPVITRLSHADRITPRTAALLRAVRWTIIPFLVFLFFPLAPTPLFLAVIVGTFALSAFRELRREAVDSPTVERAV